MKQDEIHNDQFEDFDLSALAPTLSKLKKQEFAKPPSGYFDNLPGRIHTQIREPEPKGFSIQGWFEKLFSREMAATLGMCMLLAGAVVWMWKGEISSTTSETFASLSNEELISAIDIQEISDQELIQIIGDENLSTILVGEEEELELMQTFESDTENESEPLDFGDVEIDELMDFYY